jgi:hypothetical protein
MGIRKLGGAAIFAVAILAAPAAAQTVTFSTSGSFSGTGCTTSLCNFGGFVLGFTPAASNSYAAPTFVDLGDFTTQCSTCIAAQSVKIASGVMFTLTISQTNPTTGTNQFSGSITGSLSYNPSSSSLVWTPTTFDFPIGPTDYALVTDAGAGVSGEIVIAAPTTDHNPNPTLVKAFVTTAPEPASLTTVPEPASMALMATGLLGLIPVARRRRNK